MQSTRTTAASGCVDDTRPGPWSTWPEADWVRRIVELGGYEVIGATGSAFVAHGSGGQAFYIWAAERTSWGPELDPAASWRRLTTVGDVDVYGDEDLWRVWTAQSFTFWIQSGPSAGSVLPTPQQLAALIEASEQLELPDPCSPRKPEPREASRVESRTEMGKDDPLSTDAKLAPDPASARLHGRGRPPTPRTG